MKPANEGLYGRRRNAIVTVPLVLLAIILVTATGYWLLGRAEAMPWPFFDCIYMAVISLTTVGYEETLPGFGQSPFARAYNIVVLLLGYGAILWAFSTILAVFVEGRLGERLQRRRTVRDIDGMSGHYVLCGVGETGRHVLDEMVRTGQPMVVVERERERLEVAFRHVERCPFIEGDAEDDAVLLAAGIQRAAGLVACLPEDKDNLYVVLSARQLNPGLRIIARASDLDSRDKLIRAGADGVVSPTAIGGLRMASELLRPRVTTFLDVMLRNQDQAIRLDEVVIPAGSALVGQALGQAAIQQRSGLLVVATQAEGQSGYTYNPSADHRLTPGMTLIVLGEVSKAAALRELVRG